MDAHPSPWHSRSARQRTRVRHRTLDALYRELLAAYLAADDPVFPSTPRAWAAEHLPCRWRQVTRISEDLKRAGLEPRCPRRGFSGAGLLLAADATGEGDRRRLRHWGAVDEGVWHEHTRDLARTAGRWERAEAAELLARVRRECEQRLHRPQAERALARRRHELAATALLEGLRWSRCYELPIVEALLGRDDLSASRLAVLTERVRTSPSVLRLLFDGRALGVERARRALATRPESARVAALLHTASPARVAEEARALLAHSARSTLGALATLPPALRGHVPASLLRPLLEAPDADLRERTLAVMGRLAA